jgi:hypothetical protein
MLPGETDSSPPLPTKAKSTKAGTDFDHAIGRLDPRVFLDCGGHMDGGTPRLASPIMGSHQHAQSRCRADNAQVGNLVTCQLVGCLRYVERHDGGYDASFGDPDAALLCRLKPEAG